MDKTTKEKLDMLENSGYADDSKEIITAWRKALNEIEIDKVYAGLKNTKDIIKAANDRIASIDKKLTEERKMSVEDREYLLGIKDSMKTLVFWLDPGDYDNRQRSIEAEIDLNVEKG